MNKEVFVYVDLQGMPHFHETRATLNLMEKASQTVAFVIEKDLLLAARKIALDRRTSVNQLVRDYLAALVEEPSGRRLARARLRKAFETRACRGRRPELETR